MPLMRPSSLFRPRWSPKVAEECGKKGVKGLIVITSGFSEVGDRDLEDEMVAIAQQLWHAHSGPEHCRHPVQLR